MRKVVLSTTALLFFIWILPLGAFIKPSQEKKVCDGQRAICLCSHLIAKRMAKQKYDEGGKILLKNGTNTNKEAGGPGGASHDYLLTRSYQKNILQTTTLSRKNNYFYSNPFVRPIDHIPKT